MGEITDFLRVYIDDSKILEEETNTISINLESNIKAQLWEGHGYDQGRLKRSIRVDSRIYENFSLITGYWDEDLAPHGIYVLIGVRGKGRAKSGPIDFLGDGLEMTLEAYK